MGKARKYERGRSDVPPEDFAALRELLGLSQVSAANAIFAGSRATIERYESGKARASALAYEYLRTAFLPESDLVWLRSGGLERALAGDHEDIPQSGFAFGFVAGLCCERGQRRPAGAAAQVSEYCSGLDAKNLGLADLIFSAYDSVPFGRGYAIGKLVGRIEARGNKDPA